MVTSFEEASAYVPLDSTSPGVDRLPSVGTALEPAQLGRLREMGWSVECRGCFWLCSREHRRIELFRDGRVIFKDPTITARYQLDDEWLEVIRFVWPNVQF